MHRFVVATAVAIGAIVFLAPAFASAAAFDLVDKIDWPAFLARQDLTYSRLPDAWENGAFTGNGLLGVMMYTAASADGGKKELILHVGRSDVMDHDANGHEVCRLPIGEFVVTPVGNLTGGTSRLDLWNAEITATINTDRGSINLRTFTHAKQIVQVINIHTSGDESRCTASFRTAEAVNPRNTARKEPVPDDQKNPPPTPSNRQDLPLISQKLRNGGGYATAWTERRSGDADRAIFLSVGYAATDDAGNPQNQAVEAAKSAAREGVPSLESSHRDWWHKFYPESFVSVPDARMESFYWMQLYKLASATRADRPAVDLMGPWFRHTPWPKIWWNLNLQLTYYPVYTGNRLELGESLCRMIDNGAANLAKNAKNFADDSETVARTTGYDCWGPGGNELCNYPWALHNYYMQYRYSMDDAMLRRLLPRMKAAMNFYYHNMKTGDDGKLHVTRGYSPEYPNQPTPNPDCNIDLGLIRWLCQALIDSCARLDISDPDLPKWKDTQANLTLYPTDENGLRISAGVGFDVSHRHYSHLLMVFPLYVMNPDDDANRALIAKSIDHWMGMPAALRGYSFTGASSICSTIGRKDDALKWLNTFVGGEGRFVCQANTMYTEAGPVIETPLSAARSLQDMLLQSWGGKLRVFPGVSDKWQDVTFDKLRGEGAFLVSASRRNGKTQWIRIESLAGEPCSVKTDVENPVCDRYVDLLVGKDGVMNLPLKKGESVVIYPANSKPDLTIAAVEKQEGQSNYYGLHDAK